MADDIPEQVYEDAAEVWARMFFPAESDEVIAAHVPDIVVTPNFRAAIESAYRAGQAAQRIQYCDSPVCSVTPVPRHPRMPACPGPAQPIGDGRDG